MRAHAVLMVAGLAACGRYNYPPPVTDPSPTVHVSALPPGGGTQEDTWASTAANFDNQGGIGRLTGGLNVHVIEDDGWGGVANLEISVEKGTLRAYLADGDGYRYIEAVPGAPARTRGVLIYMGGILVFRLQAVDGEAGGVKYHVWRDPLEVR